MSAVITDAFRVPVPPLLVIEAVASFFVITVKASSLLIFPAVIMSTVVPQISLGPSINSSTHAHLVVVFSSPSPFISRLPIIPLSPDVPHSSSKKATRS